MISDDQLRQIMPNLATAKRQLYLAPLNAAMATYEVDTMLRTAAFVAQLAHESGEFRFMEEIWGPTPAQLRYEPPSDLAKRLGNTEPGDGKRFKGRGPIQITGRFNYARYGGLLGLDLVGNPVLAATPEVAFATAGLYWRTNGLNALADQNFFTQITKRINGGTNGLEDRLKYYARAKAVLATGFEAGTPASAAAPVSRGARPAPSAAPAKPARAARLLRGHEAIAALAGDGDVAAPSAAKKGAAKGAARKTAVKKTVAKKAVAAKAPVGRAATTKAPAPRAPARKVAAKAAVTKVPATKAAANKVPAKKAPAKKARAAKG